MITVKCAKCEFKRKLLGTINYKLLKCPECNGKIEEVKKDG